jgi:RNA polymerase sigma factor (sigma-70 family)
MEQDTDEQELIGLAVAGDEHALKLLLLRHFDRLAAHIAAKLPIYLCSTTDPEDILQVTFAQAFRFIRVFEPRGDGSLYAWLVTIADRKLSDRMKFHNAQKRGGGQTATGFANPDESAVQLLDTLADGTETPSRCVMRGEMLDALHGAINRLPEDHRLAIRLCCLERLPAAEVARRMNRTEHAVHMLCSRARGLLRKMLGRSSQYFPPRG